MRDSVVCTQPAPDMHAAHVHAASRRYFVTISAPRIRLTSHSASLSRTSRIFVFPRLRKRQRSHPARGRAFREEADPTPSEPGAQFVVGCQEGQDAKKIPLGLCAPVKVNSPPASLHQAFWRTPDCYLSTMAGALVACMEPRSLPGVWLTDDCGCAGSRASFIAPGSEQGFPS